MDRAPRLSLLIFTGNTHHRRPERGEEREEHVVVPGLGVPEEVRQSRHERRGLRSRQVLGLSLDERRDPPVVEAEFETEFDAGDDLAG